MQHSGTANRIASRAVKQFPKIFRGKDRAKPNLDLLADPSNSAMTLGSRRIRGPARRRSQLTAFQCRGRRRAMWVDYVHEVLLPEYERLRAALVNVGSEMLLQIAYRTVDPESPFPVAEIEANAGRPITQILNYDWIQSFHDRAKIVTRKQSGALARSEEHRIHTEQLTAYHFGKLEGDFQDGVLDENMVETWMKPTFYSIKTTIKCSVLLEKKRFHMQTLFPEAKGLQSYCASREESMRAWKHVLNFYESKL